MSRNRALTAVFVVVGLLTSCTGDPTEPDDQRDGRPVQTSPAPLMPEPGTDAAPSQIAIALQQLLDEVVATGQRVPGLSRGAPGIAVAVVTDEWTWTGSAGVDGVGQAVQPDSMMAIGGITKTLVAAEVLHLASEGTLDLEAPLSRYVDHPAVGDAAIVEQALGMRAGFRDEPVLAASASADTTQHWEARDVIDLLAGPAAAPAQQPVLSDVGYVVLSVIVEEVTGGSLAQAITSDLLEPAGLERLVVQDEQQPVAPIARPASDHELPPPDGYLPYRSLASLSGGAGGMAGDAPTLARWGYLLYGGHVLEDSSVARMTDPAEPDVLFLPRVGYGLGTMVVSTSFGHQAVGHVSDLDGYSGALSVVPERGLSIAVLAVGDGFASGGLVERLTTVALPDG